MSVVLTGEDTHAIGSIGLAPRVLADFGDGDVATLDFPNNLVEAKTGKNGNTIYSFNASGKICTYIVRVLIGSDDDKFFNSEMNKYFLNPASYVLLGGEFVKKAGDGKGNITNILYSFDGGIIQKMPNTKDNVGGDTEQNIAIWQIIFANTNRAIS